MYIPLEGFNSDQSKRKNRVGAVCVCVDDLFVLVDATVSCLC